MTQSNKQQGEDPGMWTGEGTTQPQVELALADMEEWFREPERFPYNPHRAVFSYEDIVAQADADGATMTFNNPADYESFANSLVLKRLTPIGNFEIEVTAHPAVENVHVTITRKVGTMDHIRGAAQDVRAFAGRMGTAARQRARRITGGR